MKEKKISNITVILLIVVTFIFFCFYLISSSTDKRCSAAFNESEDVVIEETHFIESKRDSSGLILISCRYVVRNDSDEDKTIRFMGMYTEDMRNTNITETDFSSERLYVVAAGSTEEIEVHYLVHGRMDGSYIDHAPRAYILEA